MNKCEEILRKKTFNLFSNQWYCDTSQEIINNNEILQKQKKCIYFSEFNKLCNKELKLVKKYENIFFRKLVYNINDDFKYLSPKKIILLLKNWCKINNYIYVAGNSNGKRFFFIRK